MLFGEKIFVDVILPLALPRLYTFGVPDELTDEISVGKRVIVQFGAQRFYTAIIHKVHAEKPKSYQVKPIDSVLDKQTIVRKKQLEFWEWMADYYLCTLGDVMQAALPSSLKLASETVIMIHPDFTGAIDDLSNEEIKVIEALEVRDKLSVKDIIGIVNKKSVLNLIKSMSEKNLVTTEEEIKLRYRPKMENFIRLSESYQDEKSIQQFFENSEKKFPKQTDVMMQFLQLSGKFTKNENEVKKSVLTEKSISVSSLETLIKKGIFEVYAKRTDRMKDEEKDVYVPKSLNEIQINSLRETKVFFAEGKTTLLHGVTGSGKTEVYIHLIEETLKMGKQVLYLLPEIALTTQIISRLKIHFGNKVGIYHSRFNENERAEVWERTNKTGDNSFEIIIGARSSIFLPYRDLGLIIVDEEHENSYKQQDPDPRYQARDCAIVLASYFQAKVLLGSATPSIETYFQATQ
jgi:primosomal protein N' (replication factor Y)